jgi:molecular chaperone GrpE
MSKKKDRADEQPPQAAPGASSPSPAPGSPAQAPGVSAGSSGQPAGECPPAAGDSSAPAGASQPGAADRAAALEAEVVDLRDKLLRKTADFDNYRKRMIREREEAARYANASLLTDVLATIDDFERAIRSAEESRDFSSFLQGVSMIERQLLETLESRWGLKRFASEGESFDPNRHEAVLRVEGPPDARPTVVEDYQRGYYLHERVLRPARVKVMVPGPGQDAVPAADVPDPDGGASG